MAVAALLGCLVPETAASAPRQRTVVVEYQVVGVEVNTRPEAYAYSRPRIDVGSPKRGERSVMVTIEDLVEDAVPAMLLQDADEDGFFEIAHEFCGATTKPVMVTPKAPAEVWLGRGSCSAPDVLGWGAWWKGTIKLEYSTKPAK